MTKSNMLRYDQWPFCCKLDIKLLPKAIMPLSLTHCVRTSLNIAQMVTLRGCDLLTVSRLQTRYMRRNFFTNPNNHNLKIYMIYCKCRQDI